jgi:hypothetical protein
MFVWLQGNVPKTYGPQPYKLKHTSRKSTSSDIYDKFLLAFFFFCKTFVSRIWCPTLGWVFMNMSKTGMNECIMYRMPVKNHF